MIRANVTPAAVLATMVLGTLPSTAPAAPARVRKVTNIESAYPSFSPDGEQILVQSNRAGNWEVDRLLAGLAEIAARG